MDSRFKKRQEIINSQKFKSVAPAENRTLKIWAILINNNSRSWSLKMIHIFALIITKYRLSNRDRQTIDIWKVIDQ